MNQAAAHIIQGDARRLPLADRSVQCAVTSPPYWSLRDYGLAPSMWGSDETCEHEWGAGLRHGGGTGKQGASSQRIGRANVEAQERVRDAGSFCHRCGAWFGCLGLEPTPELYVEHVVQIFREVRRVLRDDGTLFLNIGDSYCNSDKWGGASGGKNYTSALGGFQRTRRGKDCDPKRGERAHGQPMGTVAHGCKPKDLVGIPWMLAFALRADGWYLRQDIIWAKPNPMPESVTDRCTKSHEYIFLLTKSPSYYYDADAIREPVTSSGGASFGPQTKGFDHRQDAGHVRVEGVEVQSRKLADAAGRNHPLGRNKRDVWFIPTQSFPEAHFATYPTRLVEVCVKAGTSERGCCRTCGAPWDRVVERVPMVIRNGPKSGGYGSRITDGLSGTMVSPARSVTVAWTPTCKCHSGDPVSCKVLDPFGGSGTTAMVARDLGRIGISVELKPEYNAIAERRLASPRRATKRIKQPRPEALLFGGVA